MLFNQKRAINAFRNPKQSKCWEVDNKRYSSLKGCNHFVSFAFDFVKFEARLVS